VLKHVPKALAFDVGILVRPWLTSNLRIKRDGLRSETAPSLSRLVQSNVEDGDDPVVVVNDVITNDEVHVPAPSGMDLDECRRNLYHPRAGGHRGGRRGGRS
jgi:hypothetical protein